MIDALVLRLDAPLMSFGGTLVDQQGPVRELPGRAMLTGLIANALGYSHHEAGRLEALQARLAYAVRQDRPGQVIVDYQTVFLGQEHLVGTGWTTRGSVEKRTSGSKEGTTIRFREVLADSVYTVVFRLESSEESPTLVEVERALQRPARPLFVGRRHCLPSGPLLLGRVEASTLREALARVPPVASDRRPAGGDSWLAWWPEAEGSHVAAARLVVLRDDRDWHNQLFAGQRRMWEGRLAAPVMEDGANG